MEEVKNRIKLAEADIAEAKSKNDTARRDRMEAYLIELQKEKNIYLAAPVPSRRRIDTRCNVVISSGTSDSNGVIILIGSQLYVLTTAHGVLEHMDDGVVQLKGGCLSLHTHANNKVQLRWSRVLYRNGLTSFSGINRCWDCALIEILDSDPVITSWAVGKTTDTLLNEHVQNVALIDDNKHIVGGTVIEESKDFAFLPTFVISGASGCGLYDDSGFII
eukprot:gene30090-39285_t